MNQLVVSQGARDQRSSLCIILGSLFAVSDRTKFCRNDSICGVRQEIIFNFRLVAVLKVKPKQAFHCSDWFAFTSVFYRFFLVEAAILTIRWTIERTMFCDRSAMLKLCLGSEFDQQ
jgi:hypothetical protein